MFKEYSQYNIMERRRWGDRRGAKLVRDIDGIHSYMAHLMPKRTGTEVYLNQEVDVTELLNYIASKNKPEAEYKTTLFHAAVTGIAKIIHMRPLLNRFVSGRKYYMRDKIILSFVAKKQFADSAEEAVMMLIPEDEYTISDFTKKIVGDVNAVRRVKKNSVDSILRVLQKLPRPVMSLLMLVFRILDFYGKMPASLTDMDFNYATVLLSNLGSIKCDAPYHHLNNFGTNSIVMTLGEIHKSYKINKDGEARIRDVMNIGMTVDERIADGFYFAKCLKILEYLFLHPELLDRPINEEFDYE